MNETKDLTLREKILKQIAGFRLIDDDFLSAVFDDKECAELLLRIILKKDLKVTFTKTQYGLKNLQGHSVRLDIYAKDEDDKSYDIEIQRSDRGAIPQRARYHSSLIDANMLDPNKDYKNLSESYVIFITENDVFNEALPLYHIDRHINETGALFHDGSHIIYVNSQIQDETELGRLMQDFYKTDAEDMNYALLAERVRYFKEDEKGVNVMCRAVEQLCNEVALDAAVKARVQSTLELIKNAMVNFQITADEAVKKLGIPQNEQQMYLNLLATN